MLRLQSLGTKSYRTILTTADRYVARGFHSSGLRALANGDSVPSAPLQKDAPSNTVNLADLTANGKFLIVGVPGAYSPGCSQRHVPEYIKAAEQLKAKGVKGTFVIAVNDAFVTGNWAKSLEGASSNDFVEVLADPKGEFSREWDVLFDASAFFGNPRSKRYAALVENGKVTKAFVEPDSTGINVSAAPKVLESL